MAVRYGRVFLLDYPAVYPWLASPYFDWRVDRAALPALAAAIDSTPLVTKYVCSDDDTGAQGCLWIYPHPDRHWPPDPPVSLHFVSNKGIWGPASRHDHIGWFNVLTGGRSACLTQALLRPRPALLAQPAVLGVAELFAAARAAGRRVVGVHHRAGDQVMIDEANAAAAGAAAALPAGADTAALDALLGETLGATAYNIAAHAARGDDAVFFVSDSVRAREAVRRRYPSVITTDTHIMHVGNDASDLVVQAAHEAQALHVSAEDGVRDVLVDWWLLASADIRVGSLTSGFVRSATIFSATGSFDQSVSCELQGDCCAGDHRALGKCFTPIGAGT